MLIAAIQAATTRVLAILAGINRSSRLSRPMTVLAKRSLASRPAAVTLVAPQRLSLADQWDRLAGVLGGAITNAQQAKQLQSSATQQLDLAQYALSTLMDELSAVMLVPGRRERAAVYVLETAPQRAVSQALAA